MMVIKSQIRIVVTRRAFVTRFASDAGSSRPHQLSRPLPQLWQAACRKVPHTQLLPEWLGGSSNQPYQAFVGDKILGATAARVMEETISTLFPENNNKSTSLPKKNDELSVITLDKGSATELFSIALSNRFLHVHASLLLPKECMELVEASAEKGGTGTSMSDHSIGTMVEATVAAVDEFDKEAVSDLARWLITGAASIWIEANPKGRLLERGGRVKAIRVGGPDHDPIFQGIAEMDSVRQIAQANDRKSAEQIAARILLLSLGIFTEEEDSFWSLTKKISDDDSSSTVNNQRSNEWVPFSFNPFFDTCSLKGGESLSEWWVRSALNPKGSFRRALFAPSVFDEIEHVDAWTRVTSSDESSSGNVKESSSTSPLCATAMIVVASKDRSNKGAAAVTKYSCFIEHGTSKTKARGLAGVNANRFIGALVGVVVEDEGKTPEL